MSKISKENIKRRQIALHELEKLQQAAEQTINAKRRKLVSYIATKGHRDTANALKQKEEKRKSHEQLLAQRKLLAGKIRANVLEKARKTPASLIREETTSSKNTGTQQTVKRKSSQQSSEVQGCSRCKQN